MTVILYLMSTVVFTSINVSNFHVMDLFALSETFESDDHHYYCSQTGIMAQLDQLGPDPLVESISYVDLQRYRN